jgi:hypothetical protein
MTPEAPMKANQENAKRSTGPTSVEGKKRSSLNAMTHGILSTITTLPGEDEAFMQSLHEDILNTYQPQDTMERCLVDRITIAMVRQVRLCQAEAAKLKLSMRPEILAESLSQVLRHSTIRRFKAEDLTDDMEYNYQYYTTVNEEMKPYPLDSTLPSLGMLERTMPKTFSLLKSRAKQSEIAWEVFREDLNQVIKTLREIKKEASNYIASSRDIHVAHSLLEDMKIIHRIPHGVDITLMTRYQVQLDNDLYRAMNALQKYREQKPKVIEGEIIDEANNDESIAA